MIKTYKYDELSNREFMQEFGDYVQKVSNNIVTNWDSCVEQLIEIVSKEAKVSTTFEIEKCLDSLFTRGIVQKITKMPKDKFDFENLYEWQQLHLNLILNLLYAEVKIKILGL